ncbi:NAD(P)/FAD-dependent oxidoreductase [Actinokineospora soli]|uniref:NAD(P)/FAD-dependent oxidoreductase n=1 Tax=Actinokineospora soli TaxID=1048753 RepID=A0ABW2TUS2_9PSEU
MLDRDTGPVPTTVEAANREWVRATVPQALHSHSFTSLALRHLADGAPHVLDALLDAGATELRLTPDLPFLACRRRTFDQVMSTAAGVEIWRGHRVTGLELDGAPRVTGVRLAGGARLDADLVLDATGRACESRRWLAAAGLPVPDDRVSPSGIACYTRFYRSHDGALPGPLNLGTAAGGAFGTYLAFAHPGDNGTFSVGIGVLPEDRVLRSAHQAAVFDAVVRATPLGAWLDAAYPISPVHAIRFPDNTFRGIATRNPVAGLHAVGDAACITNPLYGRGVALGIAHAFDLAQVLPDADAAAELAEDLLLPWYERAVVDDVDRNRGWRMAVLGQDSPPAPTGHLSFGHASLAAARDPLVAERLAAVRMSVGHPDDFYADLAVRSRIADALAAGPPPSAGPSRPELVELVEEAA